jgi:hypothetical protein
MARVPFRSEGMRGAYHGNAPIHASTRRTLLPLGRDGGQSAPGPDVHADGSSCRGTQWPFSHWSVSVQ